MNKCYFVYFPLHSVGDCVGEHKGPFVILNLRNIFGVYSTHCFCYVVSAVVRLSLLHGNLRFSF